MSWIDTLLSIFDHSEHTELHFHNIERWFGIAAPQTATNWMTSVSLTPFVATSGNGEFGTDPGDEAQVIGSADTPIIPGMVKFDFRRFSIVDVSDANLFYLRIVYGTGTMSDAEAAGQYTETTAQQQTANGQNKPLEVMIPKLTAGTKVWVRAKNATNNATVRFVIGIHEYPSR